jgi:hypothetical protein
MNGGENVEDDIKNLFSGLKGIVFLDTLGDKENAINQMTSLDTGLPVLEIREVGLDGLKHLISESIEKAKKT